MKAKDIKRPTGGDMGLSILKINKSEARQRSGDGSPPTGSPPTEGPPTSPVDPDGSPAPAPASQDQDQDQGQGQPDDHHGANQGREPDLPFTTPRNVDDVDFDEEAFQAALAGSASGGAKGEEVCGTVISHESDGVYVDIGGKAPGWLPRRECGFGVITDLVDRFPQGTQLKVLVTGEQNAEGMVTVSCRALMVRDSWATVTRLAQEAVVTQAVISGFNRGGCTCTVEGLRGFIPRSQLADGDNHSALVGKTIGVTVLEANPKTAKLVLSEKQAFRTQRLAELKVGDLVTGQVSGLKRFGYFVDLGSVSGLLHQRCISAGHIRDLREVFTVGETISALVTDIDAARGRIALNTALLENLPGEMLVAKAEVMGQAEQRAERARAALFQEQRQDREPQVPQHVDRDQPASPRTHLPAASADHSPGLSAQGSAPDQLATATVPVAPPRPTAPLPGDDSSA